jgi:hypothetical protein
MSVFTGTNGAMIFNTHLKWRHKILLFLGWHVQVRVYGPRVDWYVTRKIGEA